MNTPTPAPWILTHAGAEHALTDVQHLLTRQCMPSIETIAHSLAQINRFTGHACRPYSVAEHSVLVCDIVAGMGLGPDAQLLALLHDAHECVVGDVSTPLKTALGARWLEVENLHAFALRHAFGLAGAHALHAAAIKQADLVALATERRDLLPWRAGSNLAWPALDTAGAQVQPLPEYRMQLDSLQRCTLPWQYHRSAFLRRFAELTGALAAQRAATVVVAHTPTSAAAATSTAPTSTAP